jgi:hypothetical protein
LCVHPLSRLPVLDGVLVVALVVARVVALVETRRRLSPCSSLYPFASPFRFHAVGVFEGVVLLGELLKVGREVSHLLLHCSHFWRLTTGREQLCINFH